MVDWYSVFTVCHVKNALQQEKLVWGTTNVRQRPCSCEVTGVCFPCGLSCGVCRLSVCCFCAAHHCEVDGLTSVCCSCLFSSFSCDAVLLDSRNTAGCPWRQICLILSVTVWSLPFIPVLHPLFWLFSSAVLAFQLLSLTHSHCCLRVCTTHGARSACLQSTRICLLYLVVMFLSRHCLFSFAFLLFSVCV